MNETFTRDDISYWMMLLLLINRPVCLALGLPSMPIIIIGLLFFISNIFQDDLFRYITGKKVIVAWGVLMLYHFINAKFCNVPDTNFRVLLNCVQTTLLLGFTVFNFILDEKRCLKTLVVGYITFLAACLFQGSFTELDRLTSLGIHTNQIGQCAGVLSIIAVLYYADDKKRLLWIYPFIFLISLLTQSRNSLSIVVISLIILFYDFLKRQPWYTQVFFVAITVISLYGASSFIEELPIIQRFQETTSDETVDTFFSPQGYERTNTILDNLLGERLVYYYLGWEDFISSPINGIGLWHFQYLHFGYPIHSEYIVHLAEGGIIGFAIYLFFLISIGKGLWSVEDKSIQHRYLIAFGAILFVSITARIFMCEFVFPLYGCIIGYYLYQNDFEELEDAPDCEEESEQFTEIGIY